MDVAIIVNPVAGNASRARLDARLAVARRVLAAERVDGTVSVAEYAGHPRELAREAVARGARLVLAWGGDGTVNEVGSALAFGDVALGIIPTGSGNGLAREFGFSWRPEDAIRGALHGRDRRIDVGELGGRVFLNIGGLGFDAHVARAFNDRPPGRRGGWPYVTITLREVWSYRPSRYRVSLDGVASEGEFFTIVLANSCQFGNRMRVAPEARVDDGWLNALLVDHRSVPAHIWRARHLLADPLKAEGVVRQLVREVVIEGPAEIPCQVDGESFVAGPRIEARVHPGAVKIRMPERL